MTPVCALWGLSESTLPTGARSGAHSTWPMGHGGEDIDKLSIYSRALGSLQPCLSLC